MPAPPQLQACSPSHGLAGWFLQTQRQLSQRAHHFILEVLPQAFEEPHLAFGRFRSLFAGTRILSLHASGPPRANTTGTDPRLLTYSLLLPLYIAW